MEVIQTRKRSRSRECVSDVFDVDIMLDRIEKQIKYVKCLENKCHTCIDYDHNNFPTQIIWCNYEPCVGTGHWI